MLVDNKFTFEYGGKSITFFLPTPMDYIQKNILNYKNFYEIDLLEEIGRLPLKKGIICDIGANIGNHSIYFSSILEKDVYAFEPNKIARKILEKNLRLNNIKNKVKVFQVALGAREEQGEMDINISNLGASQVNIVPNGSVSIKTLDSYISSSLKVSVLKIDTEGFEVDVLEGAKKTIERDKPLIIIETQTHQDFLNISSILLVNYIPIGQKAKTKTVFFIAKDEFSFFSPFFTFLIREDIDYSKRVLESKTIKVLDSVKALDELIVKKFEEDKEHIPKELNESLNKLSEEQNDGIERVSLEVKALDELIVKKFEEDKEHIPKELNESLSKLSEDQNDGIERVSLEVKALDELIVKKFEEDKEHIPKELNESLSKLSEEQNDGIERVSLEVKALDELIVKKFEALKEDDKSKKRFLRIQTLLENKDLLSKDNDLRIKEIRKSINILLEINHKYDLKIEKLFDTKIRKLIERIKKILGKKIHNYSTYTNNFFITRNKLNEIEKKLEEDIRSLSEYINFSHGIYNEIKNIEDNNAYNKKKESKIVEKRFSTLKSKTVSNKVFIGIAAIPSRAKALEKTIKSLITQADNIGVYLNGWDSIPNYLKHKKIHIIKSQDKGDIGDAGKFYWINNYEGYYFTCDDDIVYPKGYIRGTIEKIKQYKFKAVIGWHGSVIIEPFENYYTATSRRVFAFGSNRPDDTYVHILGTGTVGFHTSTIKVRLENFLKPNMADVFFAELGQKQKVSFIVMKHEAKKMLSIEEVQADSINKHAINNIVSKKNTKKFQNELVKTISWKLFNGNKLKVLMLGRFTTYTKGGIYKSNHLIKKTLTELGHEVIAFDSQSEIFSIERNIDIAIIYPGDPNRPDFEHAENKMQLLREKGIPIYINISYNTSTLRSHEIVKKIKYYNSKRELSPVFLMTFSDIALSDSLLFDIKDFIVPFPKTIIGDSLQVDALVAFDDREGIVLGDATKLMNKDITGGDITPWVTACKKLLPHVKLYVFKQYGGKFDIPGIETVPYMKEGFLDWTSQRRIFVCLNTITTFEMTPTEAQLVGTPVVYRPMPQSLTEYIGRSGISVTTPNEFAEMCAWLYNDQFAWESYSKLSLKNSQTNKLENLSIGLETALRKILFKTKQMDDKI